MRCVRLAADLFPSLYDGDGSIDGRQPEGGEAPKPGQLDRKPFKLHVEAGAFTDSEIIVMLGEVGRYVCMYMVGGLGERIH